MSTMLLCDLLSTTTLLYHILLKSQRYGHWLKYFQENNRSRKLKNPTSSSKTSEQREWEHRWVGRLRGGCSERWNERDKMPSNNGPDEWFDRLNCYGFAPIFLRCFECFSCCFSVFISSALRIFWLFATSILLHRYHYLWIYDYSFDKSHNQIVPHYTHLARDRSRMKFQQKYTGIPNQIYQNYVMQKCMKTAHRRILKIKEFIPFIT